MTGHFCWRLDRPYFTTAFATALWLISSSAVAQDQLWQAFMRRGLAQEQAGDYAGAVSAYREAVRAGQRLPEPDVAVADSLNSLAIVHKSMGRLADAEFEYRSALRLVEKSLGKRSSNYALLLSNLAVVYFDEGAFPKAKSMLLEALSIQLATLPADHKRIAATRASLNSADAMRR